MYRYGFPVPALETPFHTEGRAVSVLFIAPFGERARFIRVHLKEKPPGHIITTNPAGVECAGDGRSIPMKDTLKELELLIRSRYSLIFLEADEEERAETVLRLLAARLGIPYFLWTRTRGLMRGDVESKGAVYGSADPVKALMHVEASGFPALYHFVGLDGFKGDRTTSELLKYASGRYLGNNGAVIVSGNSHDIPENLRSASAVFRLPAPGREEYRELLGRVTRDMLSRMNVKISISGEDTNRLLNNLTGLTLTEAEKIITKLIVEDGKLSPADVRKAAEAKRVIVEREGVLEYYPAEENMSDIADLAALKSWLSKRKEIVANPEKAREFGLTFPKGILLLGVPGCGKSLCARAVAMEWGLPLLRMDPSSLYNKYIGESEKNFKRAMRTAEKMSPVVLWIDEIEKAFSSDGGAADGGLSTRIFGTFLSWLQERKGDVFIVATANDVKALPPEFMRKGRFDEVFFVDLPDAETRRAIFSIHLEKRGKNPDLFDLAELSDLAGGFSGSEIEQVIVSGLYSAFSERKELSTEILLSEISATRPLSETMSEKIALLREWARDRTVSAH